MGGPKAPPWSGARSAPRLIIKPRKEVYDLLLGQGSRWLPSYLASGVFHKLKDRRGDPSPHFITTHRVVMRKHFNFWGIPAAVDTTPLKGVVPPPPLFFGSHPPALRLGGLAQKNAGQKMKNVLPLLFRERGEKEYLFSPEGGPKNFQFLFYNNPTGCYKNRVPSGAPGRPARPTDKKMRACKAALISHPGGFARPNYLVFNAH